MNYWDQVTRSRFSRRRILATTGGGVLSAAFLAACGGGQRVDTSDKTSLLYKPVDTTNAAKAGGVLKHFHTNDIPTFDILTTGSGNVSIPLSFSNVRLLKFSVGKLKPADGGSEGDTAESYEVSPDRLQITMKLRQGMPWDRRAPTNGRLIDAQDVLFSWNKFASKHPNAGNLARSRSPSAPVESVTAPDNRTIVFKMAKPDATAIASLTVRDHLTIVPRESEGGFDPRSTMRSAGPWQLEEYNPSVGWSWIRNPDYYVKDRPLIDRVEVPLIIEPASRLSQFRAGNIYTHVASPENVIQTKKDLPQLNLHAGQALLPSSPTLWFGYEGRSPFKDQRARQAISLLIDRVAFNNVINNVDNFHAEGYPLDTPQSTIISSAWGGWWLNPDDEKTFGPNAKYLKFDPAEAKKLLSASGSANSDVDFLYPIDTSRDKTIDVFAGMWADGGLKINQRGLDRTTEYFDGLYYAYRRGSGPARGYSGIGFITIGPTADVAQYLYGSFHKDGGQYRGVTPDGNNAYDGDPKLNDLIDKVVMEFDRPKQQALTHEVQRYVTGQAYAIGKPFHLKPFELYWPALANVGVYNYWSSIHPAEGMIDWWIDASKPPLAKA